MISPLPSVNTSLNNGGNPSSIWFSWFSSIYNALNGPFQLSSYTVAQLPSAKTPGQIIYVSDATGGAIPAFSDGTNFRRVDTRAIVT